MKSGRLLHTDGCGSVPLGWHGQFAKQTRKILSYSRLRREARECGIHLGTLAQNSSYSGP